jgi:hypothetical protein
MYSEENIWLHQSAIAELFGCSADNISLHLKNVFQEKELDQNLTTEDFSVVQTKKKSPQGKIMPSDVVIAKNYLNKSELKNLDRIGNMYLDYAEMQAAKAE